MHARIGTQYLEASQDSPKCVHENVTQDCQRGNTDFGAAFLEKMNDQIFDAGPKSHAGADENLII
jgi:hypothetical protein